MKKVMKIFGAILFVSIFLQSCGNSNPNQDDEAKKNNEQQNTIALLEKAKQDSINSLIPEIKVSIYVRTDVGYDSDGYPIEMGKVVLVKDFQEKKEYQLNGYDYIEKIEIVGQSNDMTLQFINGKNNKIVNEEKAILLNGTKTYTTSDPAGEKHKYYQEWLNTKWDALIIKVLYKDRGIFEGKINSAKQ
jgi:PBP1b-binding outer membrane lipoprotein LpoB